MKWNLKKSALGVGATITAPVWAPLYPAYAAIKNPKEFAKMMLTSSQREGGYENPRSVQSMATFVGRSAVKDIHRMLK